MRRLVLLPTVWALNPGLAEVETSPSHFILKNQVLEARVVINDGNLEPIHFTNLLSQRRLPTPSYALQADGSSTFSVLRTEMQRLEALKVSQLSERSAGWRLVVSLRHAEAEASWSVELRDGANAVKVSVSWGRPAGLCLLAGQLDGRRAGEVDGVPVVSEDFFLAVEDPKGSNIWKDGKYRCCLTGSRGSLVLGAVSPGQVRRSFWHYLERERAHPSRRMLHYNTWYDIGTGQQYSAAEARSRVQEISREMEKRGVAMDAFLLDDGWDDPDRGPWQAHENFAELAQLTETSQKLKTNLGVWFSPFGGYHEPRQRRVMAAREAGFPVREEVRTRMEAQEAICTKSTPCKEGEGKCHSNEECEGSLECWHTTTDVSPPGIDLSQLRLDVCFDPAVRSAYLGLGIKEYYDHFEAVLMDWISRGARLFKLDGIGNPAGQAETLEEDFDAAMSLIASLRKRRSDIFINLSTGTWPSPFWLLHSDTVWRRGHDHYFEGEGPARERWLTYRDAMVFQNVVMESPLFPLNSLMIHGIIFAKDAWDLQSEPLNSQGFRHEVRSAFGSGVMLQELYLTPSLLRSEHWDDLAEAARWAAQRVDVFRDVRWFGGDPRRGEVYGWAAWQSSSAVLTLRNPSASAQTVDLEASEVFELPKAATATLVLSSPFADQRPRQVILSPGERVRLQLPGFAVLVFDSEVPRPSAVTVYLDMLRDHGSSIFWSVLVIAITLRALQGSSLQGTAASTASAARPEELRQKRLQALQEGRLG